MSNVYWPLYEVFVRSKQGLSHRHVGSLHAADDRMALENARDAYTRRSEGCSIWVVKASEIVASQPEESGEFSIRRKARSTAIRRFTPSLMVSSICEVGDEQRICLCPASGRQRSGALTASGRSVRPRAGAGN